MAFPPKGRKCHPYGEKMASLCREFGIARKTGYKIRKTQLVIQFGERFIINE